MKGNDEVIADKENIIKEKIEMIKSLSTEIGLFTGESLKLASLYAILVS